MAKKNVLTQADVELLKKEFRQDFPTKEDFQTFKSEFFNKIDPILKEVTTAREERPLIENRLEKLEEIHQTGVHTLAF